MRLGWIGKIFIFITFCDRNQKLLCFYSIIVTKCYVLTILKQSKLKIDSPEFCLHRICLYWLQHAKSKVRANQFLHQFAIE